MKADGKGLLRLFTNGLNQVVLVIFRAGGGAALGSSELGGAVVVS